MRRWLKSLQEIREYEGYPNGWAKISLQPPQSLGAKLEVFVLERCERAERLEHQETQKEQ